MPRVLIVHAEGEEQVAEDLAVPLRAAGYDVVHFGSVLVGESLIQEMTKELQTAGPVVLCGTMRTAGSRFAHRIVNAAQQNPNIRVFAVQVEKEAFIDQLAFDGTIARFWENPAKAMEDLLTSLAKYYPVAVNAVEPIKAVESEPHTTAAVASPKQYEITTVATGIIVLLCLLLLLVRSPGDYGVLDVALVVVATLAILLNLYVNRRYWALSGQRLRFAVRGASRWDTLFDLLRIVGLAGLIIIPYTQHTGMLLMLWGQVFLVSLLAVALHPVYWLLKKPGLWDREYKLRKQMSASAITYASMIVAGNRVSSEAGDQGIELVREIENAIDNIELNALIAIKSYLEYSVMDLDRDNFNVNLIVKDPSNDERLVCIRRANAGRNVPKFYDVSKMPTAMRSMTTRRPIYKPNFVSTLSGPKDYKMIWHVPIMSARDEGECIGLLAVDSPKPKHLSLVDKRESLLFNLTPYIALLRLSLALRTKYDIWY